MNRTLLYSSFLPSSYWNAVISKKRHIDTLSPTLHWWRALPDSSPISSHLLFSHLVSLLRLWLKFDSNLTRLKLIIDSRHIVSDFSQPSTRIFVRLFSWLWHLFFPHRRPTLRQFRLFILLPQKQLRAFFRPATYCGKKQRLIACISKKNYVFFLFLLLITSLFYNESGVFRVVFG